MIRNHYIKIFITLILGVLVSCTKDSSPPNVLMISVDDLNNWIEPLGGHPQAKTPILSKFAEEAMVFHNNMPDPRSWDEYFPSKIQHFPYYYLPDYDSVNQKMIFTKQDNKIREDDLWKEAVQGYLASIV